MGYLEYSLDILGKNAIKYTVSFKHSVIADINSTCSFVPQKHESRTHKLLKKPDFV